MSHYDHHDEGNGISRRKVREGMTWAGTGVLWTISGGSASSTPSMPLRPPARPSCRFPTATSDSTSHLSERRQHQLQAGRPETRDQRRSQAKGNTEMKIATLRSLVVAAAILVCLGGATAQAQDLKVTIDNFTFTPADMTVKVGDTVTWTNTTIFRTPSCPRANSAPRRWIPTTASRSPSPPRVTTSIFVRCTRT